MHGEADATGEDPGGTEPRADGDGHQMPGWVKAFLVVGIVLAVVVVVIVVTGFGGPHGPSRHGAPASGPDDASAAGPPADPAGAATAFAPSHGRATASGTVVGAP